MSEALRRTYEHAKNHGIDLSKLPQNVDMNAETITANVHAINANCQFPRSLSRDFLANDSGALNDGCSDCLGKDERMKFIFKNLVCRFSIGLMPQNI